MLNQEATIQLFMLYNYILDMYNLKYNFKMITLSGSYIEVLSLEFGLS